MNNIFEQATKQKLRFPTTRGNLSVEQLWDLPLETGDCNLYQLAESLLEEVSIKPAKKLSFFKKSVAKDETAELRFEIVKHIVTSRVAEIESEETRLAAQTELDELDALISEKEKEAQKELSLDELKKKRAELAK